MVDDVLNKLRRKTNGLRSCTVILGADLGVQRTQYPFSVLCDPAKSHDPITRAQGLHAGPTSKRTLQGRPSLKLLKLTFAMEIFACCRMLEVLGRKGQPLFALWMPGALLQGAQQGAQGFYKRGV